MRHASVLTAAVLAVGTTLSLLLVSCSASSPEEKLATHRQRGLAYFEQGKFQEAIIEFRNVLQIAPRDADGHYRMALSYLQLGGLTNLQAAFVELANTTALDPTNHDARLKLGFLYLLGREPFKAAGQADEVLLESPQDVDALVLRGQSLIGQKEYEQGIIDMKKAIELNPKNMGVRLNLARTYMLMKDAKSAEAVIQEAIAVDPKGTTARLELANFRALSGRLSEAEAEYRRVIETAPDQDIGYMTLAGFYRLHFRWSDAEKVYQDLAARKPKDDRPQMLLGNYYTYLGQDEKAQAAYQHAVDLNPKSQAAKNELLSSLLDGGKIDEAETRIKERLQKNPQDIDALLFNARERLARGKTEEAIELLQKVLASEPQSPVARYFLGLAYRANNYHAQARRELIEAVRLGPALYQARSELASLHLAEDQLDNASEQAHASIRLNPLRTQPFLVLGDVYLRKGDLAKAKVLYEAFTNSVPKEPLGYFKLGMIARAEKRDADALAHFEKALAVNPDFVDALAQIAQIKISQRKLPEARDRISQQIEKSPTNPLLYMLRGQVLAQTQDFDGTETAFKKAIELDPNRLESYLTLADFYRAQGKTEKAIKEYETLLAKNPNRASVHYLLGRIHEQEKQYEKAKAHFKEALQVDPKFWQAANSLAYILAEHGGDMDLTMAVTLAENARELAPKDPAAADTLGWIYYKKKRYDRAVGHLKEAAQGLPDNPIVLYHYGMALFKTGDRANARRVLEAALKLSTTFPGAAEVKQTLRVL